MKFSIITPSFNQLDWLELCVASVKDQVGLQKAETGKVRPEIQVEHIIQDAGTEGLLRWVNALSRKLVEKGGVEIISDLGAFELLHLRTPSGYTLRVFSEPDGGMYDAINKGLSRATGEVCAYLNCDEQYLEGSLMNVADWMRGWSKKGILFADAVVVNVEGEYICTRRVVKPSRIHTCLCHLNTLTCSTFFHREVLDEHALYFPEGWRNCGDAAWVVNAIDLNVPMQVINENTSVFTDTDSNMGMNEEGAREKVRLAGAYSVLRYLSPAVVLAHRLRKWVRGLYRMKAFTYAIYTRGNPDRRVSVNVKQPTTVWPGRFGWSR